MLTAGCIFTAIEGGQFFLQLRTDLTDILVGMAGTGIGVAVGRWLQAGVRGNSSSVIEQGSFARPERGSLREQGLAAGRLLPQMPVHQLLRELDALVFHQLHVRLTASIERHADLPRPREDFRILDRGLVLQRVRVDR